MRYATDEARQEGRRLSRQRTKAAHREANNQKERERYHTNHAERIAQRAAEEVDHDMLLAQGLKRCRTCQHPKALGEFRVHPFGRDGRNATCDGCRSAKKRARRLNHLDETRAQDREWNHRRDARKQLKKEQPGEYPTTGTSPLAWVAGFIDAEGSIVAYKTINGRRIYMKLIVSNTSMVGLTVLQEMFGGSIYHKKALKIRHKPVHQWELTRAKASHVIMQIEPFLVAKTVQARLARESYDIQSLGAYQELTVLNRRGLWKAIETPREPSPMTPTANDLAYLAGLLDGDGTLTASVKSHHVGIVVFLANSNIPLINWVRDRFGGGITIQRQHKTHHRPVVVINWCGMTAQRLLRGVLPFLKERQRQAEILLELSTLTRHYDPRDSDGKRVPTVRPETRMPRERLITELRSLNQRGIPLQEGA